MRLHPYRDDGGRLWPELDWRSVSGDVLARYLGVSRDTLHRRTIAGALGDPKAPHTSGIRALRIGGRTRFVYVPARVFMAQRLGRYADPAFDWRQFEGRVRLRCDDSATPAAAAATAAEPLASAAAVLHLAEAVRALTARTPAEPIPFPRVEDLP